MRVCVVKQHTTYDLFTRTGPDLREIVESSNWRSGPLGLWEAFETSARIVLEDDAPECRVGRRHWSHYVQGWDVWPADSTADLADNVDWSRYDVVVAIDVAVPTRIVKRFPQVMWCYYFIEGGPTGIDRAYRGSPYYAYNVFLNHRLAKQALATGSRSLRRMTRTRRAVLDFPYYMQSARSVRSLYPELDGAPRSGFCLSHHSRDVLTRAERAALTAIGPVRTDWEKISDIHRAELASRYFVIHPVSRPTAGLAVIEAVSAGCLALAPRRSLWGFPELLLPELEFTDIRGLLELVAELEDDPSLREQLRSTQARRVDRWCFENPAHNLRAMWRAFQQSSPAPHRQRRAEIRARVAAHVTLTARGGARRLKSVLLPARTTPESEGS